MVGIVSYGAYIPYHRITRGEFNRAWGGFSGSGEIAVAAHDEDSITMAVEAATDCLTDWDPRSVDALVFATTTSPYKERLASTIIAAALDLPPSIRTMDITGSLRSGATAIGVALDAVKSGSARSVLVAMSDCRLGAPSGELEQALGSGSAAVLVGRDRVVAEISGYSHRSNAFSGTWRSEDDVFVRSWEDRMVLDVGYSSVLPEVIAASMQQCSLGPADLTRAVFDAPANVSRHLAVARSLGIDRQRLQDPMLSSVGITGAAMAPMMLASALEEARAQDTILFASYGDGAESFILQVTPAIGSLAARRGVKRLMESKRILTNYETYLRWRGIIPLEAAKRPQPTPTSISAQWRNMREILGLYGVRCLNCGTPQYVSPSSSFSTGVTPIQVCAICHATKGLEPYRFADKKGTVFTFTQDDLAASVDPPATVVVLDFDGGGRGMFDLTDRDPSRVEVGMRVEMTFRRLSVDHGIHNYYWKARPIRCEEEIDG